MDNNTRKMLGLTDENITFPENWLEDVKIKGVTAQLIIGSLTYNPTHCEKCGRKNQGEIVKNGTNTTRTQMALFRNTLTYLELKRLRFLCRNCGQTIMDLHSKKIIGYSFDKKMDTTLVLRTLEAALKNRKINSTFFFS